MEQTILIMHLFNLAPSILHSTCIQQHLASMETLNYKSFAFAEEMRNTSSVVISCFYCPTYANANVYHAYGKFVFQTATCCVLNHVQTSPVLL